MSGVTEAGGLGSLGRVGGPLFAVTGVTAMPVPSILLPSLWDALRITLALGRK